jgi:putative ABC transport system permease protein
MQTLRQDLRYSVRTLAKTPGFIAVAVITLALGIGANTAIFSVVNAVLLRPLPYKDPGSLVAFRSLNLQSGENFGVSPADYLDWRQQTQSFEQIALYTFGSFSFKDTEHPEQVPGARVSTNFFQTLGVEPHLGRSFTAEEGQLNGPSAVVLSYKLWQRRFGGDRSIIGKTIESYDPFASSQRSSTPGASAKTVNAGTTVIGVMPPDFKFPSYIELWTPLALDGGEMKYRASRYMQVVGRLKSGQTLQSAQAEMKTIAGRLESQYPKDDKGWTIQLVSLREHLVRDTKLPLLILLGAVGFVLLIACANVANLLLARAASRRREIAVRLALGASRWQLMQQLLVESLLLAFFGGAFGLLLASWGVSVFVGLLPQYGAYRAPGDIHIDGTVLFFTLIVTTLTGLIFGLVPGWQSSRPAVNQWLKEGTRGGGEGRQLRVRNGLVVAEIGFAMVLLVGAGLLLNSFARLRSVDLGYDSRGVLSMWVTAPVEQYRDAESKARFYQQMLDEIARVPGVQGVTLTSSVPLGGIGFPFNIEGHPLAGGDANTRYSAISANYFQVLRAKMRAGREFDGHDDLKAPAVMIVNETMARQYFSGTDPLGQRISLNYLNRKVVSEIVGVVADLKQDELGAAVKPEVFVPFSQQPWFSQALLIRANESELAAVKKNVQRAIWNVDRNQVASAGGTLDQELKEMIAEPRLYTILLGTFAVLALLLSAVGIYGVMAYSVAQRTQEIGVRMALGAQMTDVLRLVLRKGLTLSLVGVAIGLAGAYALTRLMAGLLFGVKATDPLTFFSVAGVLLIVALLACYLPARRATKVDPLVALRYE